MMKRLYLRWIPLLLCLFAGSAASLLAQGTYAQSRIDVAVVVSDLDRSVAFYENVLGMQRAYGFDVDTAFARESGLTAGEPLHVIAMRLTAEEDAPVLKLVQTGEPDAYRPEFITSQAGVRYLTVFVTALAPVLERLREHEVPVLGDGPLDPPDGDAFALVQDPDGVFIELIGPMHAPASP